MAGEVQIDGIDDVTGHGGDQPGHGGAGDGADAGRRRPAGLALAGLVVGLALGSLLTGGTDRGSGPVPPAEAPAPRPPPAPSAVPPVEEPDPLTGPHTIPGPPALAPGPGVAVLAGPLAVAAAPVENGAGVVWVLGPDSTAGRPVPSLPPDRAPTVVWVGDDLLVDGNGQVHRLPVAEPAGVAGVVTEGRVLAAGGHQGWITAGGGLAVRLDQDPPLPLVVPGLGRPLAVAGDGLVWLAPSGRGPGVPAAVVRVDATGAITPLASIPADATPVVGRGDEVVFVEPGPSSAGRLVVVDVVADEVRSRALLGLGPVAHLCPSPDGSRVVVVDVSGSAVVVEAATGWRLARIDGVAVSHPALGWVSGEQVVYRTAGESAGATSGGLWVLDLSESVSHRVADLYGGSGRWVATSPLVTCR
jgi:hypothetical protein